MARLARLADRPGAPSRDELPELRREALLSRRRFLQAAASAGAGAAALSWGLPLAMAAAPRKESAEGLRVAIVGAGFAGLSAAYHLQKAGVQATVFEGRENRLGGRVHSIRPNVLPQNYPCGCHSPIEGLAFPVEHGAEFIDSTHADMHAFVREFGLELFDAGSPSEEAFEETYHFGGAFRSEREIIEAFQPLARIIARDREAVEADEEWEGDSPAARLDRMSVSEYLQNAGVSGWLRDLLEVAYVGEYGLPAGEQSALNLVYMIETEPEENGFLLYGDSDERYKILGGNQTVAEEIGKRLEGRIRFHHRLEALRSDAAGRPVLTFQTSEGSRDEVADIVLLTIPFTVLRGIDLQIELPEAKRHAIQTLGYGTNAKLIMGVRERAWRAQGKSGEAFSDRGFQCCWDASRGQPGTEGALTLFTGGELGRGLNRATPEERAREFWPQIDPVFPGLAAAWTGKAARAHWPSDPFALGSYACFKPGQYVAFQEGVISEPVGRIYFAGEHCDDDFQGYMNGAAKSGREAAEVILEEI
jgi:monoamine oxidase